MNKTKEDWTTQNQKAWKKIIKEQRLQLLKSSSPGSRIFGLLNDKLTGPASDVVPSNGYFTGYSL